MRTHKTYIRAEDPSGSFPGHPTWGLTMPCIWLASLVVLVMLLETLIERFGDEYRIYMKRTGRLSVRI